MIIVYKGKLSYWDRGFSGRRGIGLRMGSQMWGGKGRGDVGRVDAMTDAVIGGVYGKGVEV